MSAQKVPTELYYPSVARAIESRQVLTYVQSTSGSTTVSSASGAQNSRRFQLPQDAFLNPKQSYLEFDARIVDDGGAANQRFRNGIGSLFQRVNVYVAGQQIEQCADYNILQRMMIDSEADDATLNSNWYHGCGTAAALAAQAGSTTYVHKIRTGLFSQPRLIPLWALRGLIEVEFVFASTDNACVATAGVIHYEVDNIRLICETHTLNAEYRRNMELAISSPSGIPLLFPSYESFVANLPSSTNDTLINCRKRSVKGLLACIREAANLNDLTADWVFSRASLSTLSLKVGSQRYPDYELRYGAPSMIEYEKALGKLEMVTNASQITYANYITSPSKAFLGLDLERFMSQDVLSGLDFDVGSTILHTVHSASAGGAQLMIFVIFDVVLMITDAGIMISS